MVISTNTSEGNVNLSFTYNEYLDFITVLKRYGVPMHVPLESVAQFIIEVNGSKSK